MTYWDNGWFKTTTDPCDIKSTYQYNELGLQTSRTVTSAGGSSQRALDWSHYPDGKLKTPLRRRRPPRPRCRPVRQLRHRPDRHHRHLDPRRKQQFLQYRRRADRGGRLRRLRLRHRT
ncbi:hypothetical protein GCM10020220_092370 [Nonomuraea rubra]